MSFPVEKINQTIQAELSLIIAKEIEFKPNLLVTVVGVETSQDLKHAKVFVSAFPQKDENYVIKTLEKEVFMLQRLLNKRFRSRPIPRIKFVPHHGGAYQEKIDRLLKKIKK